MKNIELFNAYLDGSISAEEKEQLKEILRTEEGSKAFVTFMAESKSLCEILQKEKEIEQADANKGKKKKWVLALVALAACMAITFFSLSDREKGFIDIATNTPIVYGQTIKANANEVIRIQSDSGLISVAESGSLKILDQKTVQVTNGTFTFEMNKRKKDDQFTVKMSYGNLRIVGTAFTITDSLKSTSVNVTEGKIELFDLAGKKYILEAGQQQVLSAEIDLKKSLELEYTFENDFTDSSGNKRDAIVRRASKIEQVDGNFAGVLKNNDCISLPEITLDGPFTLSIWVKLNGTKKTDMAILTKGNSSWRLSLYKDELKVNFGATGLTPEFINSNQELQVNKWHLITGVFDGKNLKLFIDGKFDSAVATEGTIKRNTHRIEIGGNREVLGRNFQGAVDGVSIFSRALNEVEIEQLFSLGRP